jgi:GT2 family glycosyltransferase
MQVKLVVATKGSKENFYANTSTGNSLNILGTPVDVCLFENNTFGLPKVYNQAIRESIDNPCVLIFAHDDLTLVDFHWVVRLLQSLQEFDIVGIAGNKRRVPNQPTWAYIDSVTHDDSINLSGIVGHGYQFPPNNIYNFGPPRQQVKLLDGLLLCSQSKTLLDNQVFFDERFDFHMYDMDFCRTAETKNLTCGTADLFLVHGNKEGTSGNYNTSSFQDNYTRYIQKWGN